MPGDQGRPGRLRVIYLGGLGRSGTTLIERLLAELPAACAAGETVHLWQRCVARGERCGCGVPFHDCAFWRRVGQEAFDGWHRVDVERVAALRSTVDRSRRLPLLLAPALRPSFRASLRDYVSYYLRLYAAVSRVSGCPAVIDSSKHASLAFCLRSCPEVDLRVVHVVRDSRAVAFSWTKQVTRPDTQTASFMTTYPPRTAAAQWILQNEALHLLARSGVPTLRMRYEDVVADPGRALAGIAAFAGLPAGDDALGFLGRGADGHWATLGSAHTASGNPVRFVTGHLPIREDQQWRRAMPPAQRRAVTALTLPLLARYGYPLGQG